MTHQAVLFDCDGTLVDSERIGVEVLLDVAKDSGAVFPEEQTRLDREAFVDEVVVALRGLSMAQCLAALQRRGDFTFSASAEPLIRERTAQQFRERLQIMPGALEFVRRLSVPYCVASSGPRAKIELSLGLTGLLELFDGRIFSSYDIGSWKPEPDLFLHAAQALGVEPVHCAVIEDSQPGVEAAVRAGMFVYAFGEADLTWPVAARAVRVRTYAELAERFTSGC